MKEIKHFEQYFSVVRGRRPRTCKEYGKVDIRVLQKALGHASIATTEIYTHVVDDQVIEAMSNHPLA